MKKTLALICVLVLALSLLAGCGAPKQTTEAPKTEQPAAAKTDAPKEATASLPEVYIKFGHADAVDGLTDKMANLFSELAAKYSDGRITIDVYPSGQLGTNVEMMEALEYGTLDMTYADASLVSSNLPQFGIVALPFIIENFDHAAKVFDSNEIKQLEQEMIDSMGIRALGWHWNGMRCFITKDEITCRADFDGVKMRSPEAALYQDTFSRLGCTPTVMAWSDAYTGIQSGVLDGTDGIVIQFQLLGFGDIAPYVTVSNHMLSAISPAISEKTWEKLDDEAKEILTRVAAEVQEAQRAAYVEMAQESLDIMESQGVTINELSDRAEIAASFESYWTEYVSEKCPDYAFVVEAIRGLV